MSELGGGFDIYSHLRERPGTMAACPHCRGIGGVDPHPELILVCKLCGAPRIQMPDGMPLDPLAFASLQKADRARKKRGFAKGLAIVGMLGAAFGVFVSLIVLIFSFFYSLFPFMLMAVPSILAIVYARSQSAAASKEVAAAVDAAWAAAGADLVRSGKVKSAAELAKVLGVDPQRAQQVFMMLQVDADIGLSQVRIDAGPVASQVPLDPRFAALEARAAEEGQAVQEAGAALDDAQAKRAVPGGSAPGRGG